LYEILEPTDSYLAFLPLAHILEFAVEMSWVFAGISIGYGKIKTLTDANVRECRGDLLEFKPVRFAICSSRCVVADTRSEHLGRCPRCV